jgi:hypothetical protein
VAVLRLDASTVRIEVPDYRYPGGWTSGDPSSRARWYCEQLERGKILYWPNIPFDFPTEDMDFLLAQRPTDSRFHKNVSYRPSQDVMRGAAATGAEGAQLQVCLREFSRRIVGFTASVLLPYHGHWKLDYTSFRPLEEEGRSLPLHKRNDLLHVDSFPTRPTGGARILRVFVNISRTKPRVWLTGEPFGDIAARFSDLVGLHEFARRPPNHLLRRLALSFGMGGDPHTRYDRFMLRFHDWLKENDDYQKNASMTRMEFPPSSTWMVFTDTVPHAVLAGQHAMEQTFIVPVEAMVEPDAAPIRILERMSGRPLGR